ncbi:hypothetical protein BC938DRAFT_479348 [Jimgerdemannia flammicorona]|uniref:Uncharacterized protein n=1 Tax=Jimgerdemannia flammicorona TaxID=994334 RepID=A0A433QL25_9FUNG|nr:hypothetical protein BC938DRAFT_479348 [Jimgerdemannia flammicorona]
MDDLWRLPPSSPLLPTYLHTLLSPTADQLPYTDIKTYPDITYHTYKPLGVSFCFTPTPANDLVLTSIDVYNPTRDGIARFPGPLPHGLTLNMCAADVVGALGEPERKGGGGSTRCWVEYVARGLHVNFEGTNWDDARMGISSVTVFEAGATG